MLAPVAADTKQLADRGSPSECGSRVSTICHCYYHLLKCKGYKHGTSVPICTTRYQIGKNFLHWPSDLANQNYRELRRFGEARSSLLKLEAEVTKPRHTAVPPLGTSQV
eukprot:1187105-Prorocentrum_minimum.AAC.6